MTDLFGGFFKNRRIIITGHTGFKGAWLALWLSELGAKVVGYALQPPTTPSLFRAIGLDRKLISIIGDIRDRKALHAVLKRHQPEVVFHLAAQSLVRRSYASPVETYEANLMGTVNILEACRGIAPLRTIVVVTSDKCYENKGLIQGHREEDPLGGHDPYSSSKACAELIVDAYRRSFFAGKKRQRHCIGLATARAGNVIGGGDWAEDRLVPDCMRAFSKNKAVIIRYPDAVRPWQYVLEPLYGYLSLARHLFFRGVEFSGAWNFGPNKSNAKPVQYLLEKIAGLWGSSAIWKIEKCGRLHEAHHLWLNCSKAKTKLGWRPLWRLPTALKNTVYWYQSFYAKKDVERLCLTQIENFSREIKKGNFCQRFPDQRRRF